MRQHPIHSLLACLGLAAALLVVVPDAEAGGRQRDRQVSRQDGSGAVNASGTTARGDSYKRGRQWNSDGQGNASGSSSGSVTGVNGGSAQRQGSAYRNADGSAGRQGSASATGPNGGTAQTSGGITRNADGTVSGSRNTSATGANGNSYTGSTTGATGEGVSHTAVCTNADGAVIDCRGGG